MIFCYCSSRFAMQECFTLYCMVSNCQSSVGVLWAGLASLQSLLLNNRSCGWPSSIHRQWPNHWSLFILTCISIVCKIGSSLAAFKLIEFIFSVALSHSVFLLYISYEGVQSSLSLATFHSHIHLTELIAQEARKTSALFLSWSLLFQHTLLRQDQNGLLAFSILVPMSDQHLLLYAQLADAPDLVWAFHESDFVKTCSNIGHVDKCLIYL